MPDDAPFSSDEVDALTDYEPVDRLALASLFFGIASVAALIHPLLWILPILSVVMAFCALRRMAAQDRQTGRRPAVTGLALALLFGSCAMTWMLSVDVVLSRESRKCCDTWLEMLREGKVYEAHQLTLDFDARLTTDAPIEKIYTAAPEDHKVAMFNMNERSSAAPDAPIPETAEAHIPAEFTSWRISRPNDKLSTLGDKMSFRYDRTLGTTHDSPTHYSARHLYLMSFKEDGRSSTMPVEIAVKRTVVDGTARWSIASTLPYTKNL
ncbi:MAG: DUF4190 domain-containing protein [Pirellulaceae bacterium]